MLPQKVFLPYHPSLNWRQSKCVKGNVKDCAKRKGGINRTERSEGEFKSHRYLIFTGHFDSLLRKAKGYAGELFVDQVDTIKISAEGVLGAV